MSFDKESLFAMFAPKVVPITVEHDGKQEQLFVRELSADQVFRLQDLQKSNKGDNEQFTINLLAQAVCDEDGNKVLDQKDAKKLAQMQVKAFNALTKAVAEAVGLATEAKPVGNGKDNSLERVQVEGNA